MAACVTVRETDLFDDLPLIVAPTLILAGEHDVPTPPTLVRDLSRYIKNSRFELIKEAGHVPPLEQPALLARRIRTHLQEVSNGCKGSDSHLGTTTRRAVLGDAHVDAAIAATY